MTKEEVASYVFRSIPVHFWIDFRYDIVGLVFLGLSPLL